MSCAPPGCPSNCPPGTLPPPPGSPNPPSFFFNNSAQCEVFCPNGVPFIWTVAAGAVIGRTQAEADLKAASLACQRARTGKICFVTTQLPDGKVGEQYDATIMVKGGVPWQFPFLPNGCPGSINGQILGVVPYEFDVQFFGPGPLPPGLSIGCGDGVGRPGQITGKPTLSGPYTFNIVATDAVGAFQVQQFTIRINGGTDYGTIAPTVFSSVGASWGTLPAGTYRVSYVNGAMRYGNNALWLLNLNNGLATAGFKIRHSGGTTVDFPGTTGTYGSQALVEAANAGKSIAITHTGGTISMFLNDTDYGDNHAGSPGPTFRLTT